MKTELTGEVLQFPYKLVFKPRANSERISERDFLTARSLIPSEFFNWTEDKNKASHETELRCKSPVIKSAAADLDSPHSTATLWLIKVKKWDYELEKFKINFSEASTAESGQLWINYKDKKSRL